MFFFRIFWKKNVQEAYLPKMSISGQIVSKMLAGYTQKTPYNPSNFLGGRPKKNLEGFRPARVPSFKCDPNRDDRTPRVKPRWVPLFERSGPPDQFSWFCR